ncbi:TcdA/TcdB pore-forming domain-containing protein [Pseudomonas mediterranea]|uniref:TcdA/TcdB pore-forming domain-containing protein n=1 Tax=Pseudomonas mediterranea TaxID=183795 RepID=UPI0006D88EE5|nr:TcdA/TcdB pore-forming domain-containing protein [Pseudomonas mediterranea]MDU9026735.1 TcdA/TcdB pore-forming domain-containing protein [Pseudomonas mediterranea]
MSERKFSTEGYVDFKGLLKLKDLEQALAPYKGTDQYEAVLRYYSGCTAVQDAPSLLKPLGLLKQALTTLPGNRQRRATEPTPPGGTFPMDLVHIQNQVEHFEARLQNSVEQLKVAATEVPKKLHFAWLGGGVGAIQRDYINIWKQVLGAADHQLYLWYDSDALLAYETNRIIVEAAKADAMSSGGKDSTDASELGDRYEERVIVLKQQIYAHIKKTVENGGSADDARVDLLVRAYGQDKARLTSLKADNRRSLQALAEGNLVLRDLARGEGLQLKDIYQREISLRGNFAAASDVVRAEALFKEGGRYTDVDCLPPLLEKLGPVDIRGFKTDARLGALQLLLDRNPDWMPGRQALRNRYKDYLEQIPLESREALKGFADSKPALDRVFRMPEERLARPYELRAVVVRNSLSNAFLMAHPGAAMLKAMLERFRFNYEVVDATARLADEQNIALIDVNAMARAADQAVTRVFGTLRELSPDAEMMVSFLAQAAATYYSDGIRPQSEVTIYLTGPGAMREGMADYQKAHFTPRMAERWRTEAAIPAVGSVNLATEEEQDHSWKENESNTTDWLANEQKRWRDDRFKARYAGDMAELLNYRSLKFDEGWPVLEGRHVLSTELLQHLADDLGDTFMNAMSRGHTGTVTFGKAIVLSFAERQSIRDQSANVLPPASLSDAQTQRLSITELLGRLAKGSFEVAQLSPLQRLLVGALIGAQTLDNRSFNAVRPQLDNLANNLDERGIAGNYATIERVLFKLQAPAFQAGLADPGGEPPGHSETALELKKKALEQPLTLRQWGRHVARIQQVAKLEYRVRITERLATVLDGFEADAIKLVPQDLLLQGEGDRVGGRCYPLALVMAAAMTTGKVAVNTLRERFYLGAIEPEASDCVTFLQGVEALREVQLSDVGNALGRSDLKRVVETLQARTTTGTLMLNSDNHAMLVARTFDGERSTYHFYDPNFGVFEFEHATRFRQALERFFIQQEMAVHYAAYGDTARPTFELIELDGERVSKAALPGSIQVAELLRPGALPGRAQPPVRQRLASAHGQSLMNNPRLGSRLLALDGHWWGQRIAEVTTQLKQQNRLAPQLVPLFETLEITSDGSYRINLIDPKEPEQLVRIVSDDHRLLRIKNYLSERFLTLANKPLVPGEPAEVGSVHTLNAGFSIQALMSALTEREGSDRSLSLAVRLHVYVNYAQLVHGNVADVAGLIGLVRQALAEEKLIARTVAPVVKAALGSSVSEATGGVLQLANVGFDIYQLSTASSEIERARFGTQLAFDSAGLVLAAGALGLGATTAGAFLGGAAVILGGLAVGVAAVTQGFAAIAEEAKQVGLFFDELSKAHLQAYRFDTHSDAWLPRPSLIVGTLDLVRGELVLDSPRLYPLRDHFGVPTFDDDYDEAIVIRRELRLVDRVRFSPSAGQAIVLPCVPRTCYRYEYKALPFAGLRHDVGFDTARRLEKKKADGGWLFLFSFYSFPSDYILYRLLPDYRPTVIDVVLDEAERSLVVPVLPAQWQQKISYRIKGAGKRCTVGLNPGVSLTLESLNRQKSSWVLDAPWANEGDIRVERYAKLFVGTVQVSFAGTGLHDVLLRIAGQQVFQVGLGERTLTLVEQEVPAGLDRQALQPHLRSLAQGHRLVMPYTPLHRYLVPFEKLDEPRHVTAWYDAKEDRFLYIRNEIPGTDDVLLGAVAGDSAYFYDPKGLIVWQADATTGLLSHRYWLRSARDAATTISRVEADAQGVVHVEQRITRADQTRDVLVYVIHDGQLLLSSVTREAGPALESVFSASETLADWSQVLGNGYPFTPYVDNEAAYITVSWQPAAFVSVCWKIDAQWRDMAWVRRSDQLIIRPAPKHNHLRGWPDSIKNMTDLTLLTPKDGSDVFIVYDRPAKALCRRRRTQVADKWQWSSKWKQHEKLENIIAIDDGYLVLTSDGLFYTLTDQGELSLGGMNAPWFKNRTHWWSALEPLARRHATEPLALVGLTNFSGDAKLCAWYIGNRLLLAEPGHGKEMRLLSVTPDGEAAWLFDVSTGGVYRQAFIDPQKLESVFEQGTRVLQADALPTAQREWASWTFAEVTVEGTGLRGVTPEGVVVSLRNREPALITGVTREWVIARDGREQKALEQLADQPSSSALLTVEDPDDLKWFVTERKRLVQVPRAEILGAFDLLGTQRQDNVLLHEQSKGRLLSYPAMEEAGSVGYAQREGEVLVVGAEKMKIDDLLPDDVTTLVLRMGQGSVSYRLTKAAWLRLESVVLDCRPSLDGASAEPGKLIWELDDPDRLLLSIVDEHLVIIDPDTGHSVIVREMYAGDFNLRGEVLLSFEEHRRYAVSKLIKRLDAQPNPRNSITLKELLGVSQRMESNAVT